jgi:hypothetical protein
MDITALRRRISSFEKVAFALHPLKPASIRAAHQ